MTQNKKRDKEQGKGKRTISSSTSLLSIILLIIIMTISSVGCSGDNNKLNGNSTDLPTDEVSVPLSGNEKDVGEGDTAGADEPDVIETAAVELDIATIKEIYTRGNIRIGVHENGMGGFQQVENGEYFGFEIDLITELVDRIFRDDIEIEWIPLSAENRLDAIFDGDVDIFIGSVVHTTSREETWGYFTTHYMVDGLTFMSKADSNYRSLDDLDGVSICTVDYAFFTEPLQIYFSDRGYSVEIRKYKSSANVHLGFAQNECDVVSLFWTSLVNVADGSPSFYIFDENLSAEIDGNQFGYEPLSMVVPFGDEDFYNLVDQVLVEIMMDGTWQEIYDRWIETSPMYSLEELLSSPPAGR